MSDNQLKIALESYITQLNQLQQTILDHHAKFRIALTDTLQLLDGESITLKNLHGSPNALKGYLIQMNENLYEHTRNAFESLRKGLESIVEMI